MLKHVFRPHSRAMLYTLLAAGLAVGTLAVTVPVAHAQTVVPSQTSPGRVIQPEEPQLQKETPKKERFESDPADDGLEEVELDVAEPEPTVILDTPKITVRSIRLEGNRFILDDELMPLTESYIGKEVTFDELKKLVEAINQVYRTKGYYSSQAYIPPQDINDGALTIKVLEGIIGKVSIEGNHFFRDWYIRSRLEQKPGEILNIPDLEDSLNRITRQEAIRAKAILSPGANTGETDIQLNIQEKQPWQISPTYDTQGRPFIGIHRGGVEISNNNVMGIGDRFSARWLGATGTQIVSSTYNVPIHKSGTELGFLYSFGFVDVDLELDRQPDVVGTSHNYGLTLSQPLDKNRTFVADAGLLVKKIDSYINNSLTNRDYIGSMQFGLNFNKPDRYGRTFARVQTTVAPLGFMGSNVSFWKNEGYLTRLFVLPKRNLLIFRAYAQMTPDNLPSAEQFQIGGAFSVRGFTEGVLAGDRGYSFTVEHRWPVPYLSYVSKWLANRVQGAFFFDMGQAWIDSSNPTFVGGVSNREERTLLMGAGVGVRAQLTRFLQGFVDFGFGLVNRSVVEPDGQPTARIHVGVRSNLLPTDYRTWGQKKKKKKKEKKAKKSRSSKKVAKADNTLKAPVVIVKK